MNTLPVFTAHTASERNIQRVNNILTVSGEIHNEDVSYEHEGYQVRVHFNGDKTLKQCIQNLAERRMGGN